MRTSFRKSFTRDLKKIKDQEILDRVALVIQEVEAAEEPAAVGHLKKITGTADCYRIRIGAYRIGVVLEADMVEFIRCLPRRDLYKYFP